MLLLASPGKFHHTDGCYEFNFSPSLWFLWYPKWIGAISSFSVTLSIKLNYPLVGAAETFFFSFLTLISLSKTNEPNNMDQGYNLVSPTSTNSRETKKHIKRKDNKVSTNQQTRIQLPSSKTSYPCTILLNPKDP